MSSPALAHENLTAHRSCIHRFPATKLLSSSKLSTPESHDHGNAIAALVQSTGIDVVGIGFTSGEISIYDIRADERLMRMFMEGGGIRALGFRAGEFRGC
jgi:U3 small nucleolar RNA-associated protein 21